MGTVSVLLVRPLLAAAGESICGAADLTPEIVADDDARITAAQFCIAWSEGLRVANDPRLALAIATAIPTGAFGIVEYVCRAAPTLGDALRRWVRYLNLIDDAVEVALEDGVLSVARESEAPAPASHELCWALVAKYARELSATPFRISAVEFAHASPGDVAPYRAWFDAPVTFGAPRTAIAFPPAAMASSLVSSDPALLQILTRAADALVKTLPVDEPLTAQVKRALSLALRDGEVTIEQVAEQLGLTGRSLQRRLKDEGTTFNDVREATRRELARRYLDDGLAIAEVSFLLGFSEPSAFFRAFKRWFGDTPRGQSRVAHGH